MKILQAFVVLAGTAWFFASHAQTGIFSGNGPERREWSLKPTDKPGHVQFSIELRQGNSHWVHGSPVPWTSFRGLTADQISKLSAPAKFEFVRDSGKLLCDGTFHLGRGLGTFNFEANPAFKSELEKLGFHLVNNKKELEYFMADVSLDFARTVKDANLRASSDDLYEMRIHGLSKEYISEIRAAGYTSLSAREYIDMKIHGVATQFVRDLKAAGYDLNAQKIIDLRIHGVDTQFMADLKKAGYDIPIAKILEMKIHGISREYIQELASYGLKPRPDDLLQMRIHGVQPEYLKGLRDAGYADLDSENVVQLRIHGVSTDFVREAKDLGYRFTIRELTDLRIHGVDSAYLRKIKNAGFQNLNADKIVQLRIHGVD